MKACIVQKTNDEPKIYPTQAGARVELEIYGISLDYLMELLS